MVYYGLSRLYLGIYIHICAYMQIYMHVTINGKRGHEFEREWGVWREGREKENNLKNISKRNIFFSIKFFYSFCIPTIVFTPSSLPIPYLPYTPLNHSSSIQ